jgi:ParB-like chromosome segregation protein Spo0J
MKDSRARPAPRMLIVYRAIDLLKLDPNNARRHSKKQIRQLGESIKAFDLNVPILIDRDGNVIAGHARLAAAGELGWTEVPTLCLDHLTPAQARAFMIADNRLAEIAVWDDPLLAQQLTLVRRWQALTGGNARHAVSGRNFDDLVREAEAAGAV